MQDRLRNFPATFNYGVGYDVYSGKQKSSAIEYDRVVHRANGVIREVGDADWLKDVASRASNLLDTAETRQKLSEYLDVDANASYNNISISTSASASLVNQLSNTATSTTVVASVRIEYDTPAFIEHPRLSDGAKAYLINNGWDKFKEKYGNYFVSGFKFGGYYYGVLSILSTSIEEQKELSAKITGGGWGADIESNINSVSEKYGGTKNQKAFVIQSGGDDVTEVSLPEMIKQYQTFGQDLRKRVSIIEAVLQDYRVVDNLPDNYDQIEGFTATDARITALKDLNQKYLYHKDLKDKIDYIIRHFSSFPEYSERSLAEQRTIKASLVADEEGVNEKLNEIVKEEEKIRFNNLAEFNVVSYIPSTPNLPSLENQEIQSRRALEDTINHLIGTVDSHGNYIEQLKKGGGRMGATVVSDALKIEGENSKLTLDGGKIDSVRWIRLHPDSDNSGDNYVVVKGKLKIEGGNNNLTLDDGNIDFSGDKLTIGGTSPFVVRKFGPFPGWTNHDTGYSTDDWEAVIGGFKATGGDIDEDDSGSIIQVHTWKENGRWQIFADFRSHKDNEEWTVWVLFIQKKLVAYM
ncbi:MAG: hypothetical protein WBA57_14955 [Elainellaceae cyanobacterium]